MEDLTHHNRSSKKHTRLLKDQNGDFHHIRTYTHTYVYTHAHVSCTNLHTTVLSIHTGSVKTRVVSFLYLERMWDFLRVGGRLD